MARNNDLVVTAGLNIEASVAQIEKDLKQVNDRLSADHALKIIANVDLSKTTQRINSQLATISKNLNLNIPKIELGMADGGGAALINNVSHIVDNVEDKIEELRKALAEKFSVSVDKIVTNTVKNASGQINSFSLDLTKLSGEVEKFSYKVNRTKDKDSGSVVTSVKQTSSRDSDRGAIKLLERQEAQVDKLTQKLAKLKAGFDNVNAPRPILNQDNINQLNEEYSKTDKIIKNIGKSTSETFDKMVSDANKAISVYENLGKTMRDAENTATDFASNNIDSAKSLLGGKIDNFITTVSKSSVADANSIIKSAESIKKSLDNIGDTQGLKTARDGFNELRGKFNSFDAAVKKSSFEKTHKAKVEQLAADMNKYAEANRRAVASTKQMSDGTSFLDRWNDLVSEMAKGMALTEDEVKHLREQLRLFGKEAETQGLKGESAWGKFLNSFKTMSSYITANMVFNFVKRQLRDMVQEVTAVDSAMVELRKVTEASDEEFEVFAKSAEKTGRELGASISDVINATSTFSRAGFDLPEAEKLGEIATLYKNVGDGIDIESASESLISVIKAFNIQADEYERIVDRINNVSNNFAIDSGGLGIALQRVSSAMDAANNSLDETIALTTVANEIVQNPEMVAQGWRTVALRIRGAKTELEDAGLETEGMVESTAKLRDLIKGISGVDIMLDENTFKSTYQIIEEIGRVWKDISDVNQASLLEAIAGKRQSNIVAAALNNYERLDQVLEKSINSENSARKEQEEYAKSIQYSIDTLKAAYQGFAQTVIKSDFVKALLGTAQNLLEVLTKIVDKVGMLPPLLSAVGVGLSRKGISVFDTVKTDAEGANRQITIFGKTFSQIRSDVNSADAKGLKKVEAGIKSVGLQAKATQLAVLAMNTAISVGISLAISGAISLVSKWVSKEKEAAEQAEKLRQEMEERRRATIENIKAYEEESKSVQDLVGQYIQLVSSTDNLAEIKDSLLSVQDQIVKKYGLEADAIDLVNGKIEDNIGLLLEQEKQRNESWLTDNRQTIKDAEEFFGQSLSLSTFKIDTLTDKSDAVKKAAVTEANIFYKSLKDALEEQNVSDLFTYNEDIIEKQIDNQAAKDLRYNISLKEGLDAEQTKRAIDAYVDAYKQLIEQKGSVADYFDLEGDRQDHVLGVLKQVSDYYDTIQTKQQMLSESESLEALLSGEDLKTYEDTVKQLTELSQTINDATATPAKRQGARQSLEEQEAVIRNLIEEYPALEDIATATLNNIGLVASGVAADEEQIYRDFLESLDNVHKGAMENINKIESAMVKLIKGEGLDHNSAWEILKLDTDKVLKPVIDSSGKYRFELDNIVALKDQIITRNKEIVMQDYNEIKSKKQVVDAELQLIKLELERTNIAIRGQSGGNSRPSESLVRQQDEQRKRVDELTKSSKAYADELERDSVLIREYNAHMGDLSGTTAVLQAQLDKLKKSQEDMKKQLDKLNKSADNLLKAQEYKIDQIIDKFQDEKDALEENKELLEEQLDTLEQQKQQIEDILKNYDDVADVISATVKDQVDEIKKNQDEVEKYYNDLIDKLKDENSERKDALDYAEKLAALENAKKNKVRVYGAATGWGYAVDRDALTKAQEALKQADDDKAIKELEKERDKRVEAYDDQIKGFEAYADEWSGIKDLLDREEKERLANELLGSEWREKIRNKDVKILNKFKNEYRSYNNQLSNLVNGEIATLKKSIESVDSEIKAKQKTIDAWNKYKKSVQDAATAAKNANEDYMKILDQVTINEASDLKTRDNNLNGFKNHYIAYMNAISAKNGQIEDTTNKIEDLTNQIAELSNEGAPAIDGLVDYLSSSIEVIALALDAIGSTFADSALAILNAESYRGKSAGIVNRLKALRGYKDGGTVDFTGVTAVHGTPNHSETVFNASQSRELYDMVKTGEFSTQIENRVIQGLGTALKKLSSGNTSTSNAVSIGTMVIKADNPKQFHDQFTREINSYMSLQLNNSYIK